jgi:hypothetical protein
LEAAARSYDGRRLQLGIVQERMHALKLVQSIRVSLRSHLSPKELSYRDACSGGIGFLQGALVAPFCSLTPGGHMFCSEYVVYAVRTGGVIAATTFRLLCLNV